MKLDKEDLEAIASAVVAKIKAEGGAIAAKGTEAKAPTAAEKKAADAAKKAASGPKREDVLVKVRELGAAKGKPKAKEVISTYAEAFGDVKDEDLGKLLADVEAALAADETAPEEAADDF